MKDDIIIRIGDRGPHVKEIQKLLKKAGFWDHPTFTEYYGDVTDSNVRRFEKANGLPVDGRVDSEVSKLLLAFDIKKEPVKNTIDKYKDVTIKGATFPDAPISNNVSIRLNKEMAEEYLPALNKVMKNEALGFKLLITIMAYKEGFRKGTRSYKTNNPGNIGNTDSGLNTKITTLEQGIEAQKNYILKIVNGKHKAYPIGKLVKLKPFYSPEIAKNQKVYGMSPHLPGYEFVFDQALEQFVKIYATGSRGGNSYLSMIISYYKNNNIEITPQSKLQDIIKIEK